MIVLFPTVLQDFSVWLRKAARIPTGIFYAVENCPSRTGLRRSAQVTYAAKHYQA